MRARVYAGLAAMGGVFSACAAPVKNFQESAGAAANSCVSDSALSRRAVIVYRFVGDNTYRSGSGVAVNDSIVITNRHVIVDETIGYLSLGGIVISPVLNARKGYLVLKVNRNLNIPTSRKNPDLATLSLFNSLSVGPSLVLSDVRKGDSIRVVGFPEGVSEPVVTRGVVRKKSSHGVYTTAPIRHGSSGSGAYNCAGELIGIVFGSDTAKGGVAVLVEKKYVQAFLKRKN